jgi:hypothetical protein
MIDQLHRDAGLMERENHLIRIKWSNSLRKIVGRRCPMNRVGASLVSDIDIALATESERLEALEAIKPKTA